MATVYRPKYKAPEGYKESKVWWYRFQFKGQSYRGTTEEKTKVAALKVLAQKIKEVEDDYKGLTLERHTYDETMLKFLDEFVPPKFGNLTESSAARYEVSARALTLFFSGKYLDEINTGLITEFVNMRTLKGVSQKTIGCDVGTLSSMFTFAIELDRVENNPVHSMKRSVKKRLGTYKKRTRNLSHEEEEAIIKCVHLVVDPYNPKELIERRTPKTQIVENAIAFTTETGLRRTECLRLKVKNLELDNIGDISGEKNPQIRFIGKGRKERIVPLTQRALNALPSKCWSKLTDPEEWVFPNPDTGKPFDSLLRSYKGAAKRCGIKDHEDLRWHDLRRTFGCRYLRKHPKDYWTLKELLGHSSIQVTESSYAFMEEEDLHKNFSGQSSGQSA